VSETAADLPDQPDPPEREALVELVLRTFRLNGLFLQVAEGLAKPAGLTAAWWQVLGAVLRGPLTVSGVAREMGLTRQSVQRVADLLVAHGLAEYRPNPAHTRARLLAPTETGWAAIAKLRDGTLTWAAGITDAVGEDDLRQAVRTMDALIAAMTEPGHGSSP
jgi:DNA-binding MarR family transcriptional regulator